MHPLKKDAEPVHLNVTQRVFSKHFLWHVENNRRTEAESWCLDANMKWHRQGVVLRMIITIWAMNLHIYKAYGYP